MGTTHTHNPGDNYPVTGEEQGYTVAYSNPTSSTLNCQTTEAPITWTV